MAKFKDDLRKLNVDEFKVKESKSAEHEANPVFFPCSTGGGMCAPSLCGFQQCAQCGGVSNCQQNCSQCASCAQCQGGPSCGSCGVGLTIACGNCGQCGGGGTCGVGRGGGGFRGRF